MRTCYRLFPGDLRMSTAVAKLAGEVEQQSPISLDLCAVEQSHAVDSDAFLEKQDGVLCAVHAAHNVTSCNSDPSLSLEHFEQISQQLNQDYSSGFTCGVIVAAFKHSTSHSCFELQHQWRHPTRLEALAAFLAESLCGFIVHEREHWFCFRQTSVGFTKVDSNGNRGRGSKTPMTEEATLGHVCSHSAGPSTSVTSTLTPTPMQRLIQSDASPTPTLSND